LAAEPGSRLTLKVENLAAARGLRMLFENMSFSVAEGEALELRGPNGSGKSTLLRILGGLTRPHAGSVALEGAEADAARHYLGHSDAVKLAETAGEQARFWASYFGRPAEVAKQALDRVGLSQRMEVPGRGLSAGQKRRLAIARLLIDSRPVWLLDEPTAGLDVEGRRLIEQLVSEHRARKGLIIAAIHGEGFPDSRTLDFSALSKSVAA
jgi:heme exporter protein A